MLLHVRYPREASGPMRERVFGLIGKRNLPRWIKAASLQNLVSPFDDMDKLQRNDQEPPPNQHLNSKCRLALLGRVKIWGLSTSFIIRHPSVIQSERCLQHFTSLTHVMPWAPHHRSALAIGKMKAASSYNYHSVPGEYWRESHTW
ncbi:unnamed protein product [Prunus armeniaca]|uniref:Uncharacterized protein n=1 Tax=Prunus armeniaca TaxID=36596 RepID=A0A6J5XVB0_PRUAR|nr:unnamed protein product [Prunus armeniaca]